MKPGWGEELRELNAGCPGQGVGGGRGMGGSEENWEVERGMQNMLRDLKRNDIILFVC